MPTGIATGFAVWFFWVSELRVSGFRVGFQGHYGLWLSGFKVQGFRVFRFSGFGDWGFRV